MSWCRALHKVVRSLRRAGGVVPVIDHSYDSGPPNPPATAKIHRESPLHQNKSRFEQFAVQALDHSARKILPQRCRAGDPGPPTSDTILVTGSITVQRHFCSLTSTQRFQRVSRGTGSSDPKIFHM